MSNLFIIYIIKNDFNERVYIGQTTQKINKRFNQHKTNKDSRIGRSIRYHGAEHFNISVLDIADNPEDADKKESFWINKMDAIRNGYNLRPGGRLKYKDDYEPISAVNIKISGKKVMLGF